ncbi:MAG: aldose epimerase family protein [Acidobacteriaceae bacterium]
MPLSRLSSANAAIAAGFSTVVLAALLLSSSGAIAQTGHPGSSAVTIQKDTPQIGGEAPVTIRRTRTGDGSKPEFLSATVLPGRAMNLFSVTAYLPGKGEINVIHSPSLAEAAKVLGGPDDATGTKIFSFGAAFLVPFANRIVGPLSADKKMVSSSWDGHAFTLPANWKGKLPQAVPHAIHGLMFASRAEKVSEMKTADGGQITGIFHEGDFGGLWFSKTDVSISVDLSGDAVIATVVATNTGNKPEPIGIGWHPYFNIPSGDRTQVRVREPGVLHAEVDNYDDVFVTGKLTPVAGTPYDFTVKGGKALDHMFLDDNWVDLKKDAEGHSSSEIIDPAAKYGLRITSLTRRINAVQVYAPIDQNFVALEPQFNYNDPFGKEWKGRDTGMVTLQPGQSVTWKVRLELFVP